MPSWICDSMYEYVSRDNKPRQDIKCVFPPTAFMAILHIKNKMVEKMKIQIKQIYFHTFS